MLLYFLDSSRPWCPSCSDILRKKSSLLLMQMGSIKESSQRVRSTSLQCTVCGKGLHSHHRIDLHRSFRQYVDLFQFDRNMNNFLACFIFCQPFQAPWSWGAYVHNMPRLLPERRLEQGWCRKLWAMQVPTRTHSDFWWICYWLKFWCHNSKSPNHLNPF